MAEAYICVRKCYFKKRIYNVGDLRSFGVGEEVPRHFEVHVPLSEVEIKRREEEDQKKVKGLIRGLRAPIDHDQAEKVKAKRGRPKKNGSPDAKG